MLADPPALIRNQRPVVRRLSFFESSQRNEIANQPGDKVPLGIFDSGSRVARSVIII